MCVLVVTAPKLTRYGFVGNRRAMAEVRQIDWAHILAFVMGAVDRDLLA